MINAIKKIQIMYLKNCKIWVTMGLMQCLCNAIDSDIQIFALIFRCSCFAPKYDVMDASENVVMKIEGPMCICQGACCTWDQEFNVSID